WWPSWCSWLNGSAQENLLPKPWNGGNTFSFQQCSSDWASSSSSAAEPSDCKQRPHHGISCVANMLQASHSHSLGPGSDTTKTAKRTCKKPPNEVNSHKYAVKAGYKSAFLHM